MSTHHGSLTLVTFATAIAVLNHHAERFEPYMVAPMAVMGGPSILTAYMRARPGTHASETGEARRSLAHILVPEVLLHGSVVLLLGSFAIGWITGDKRIDKLGSVFVKPFDGILCVFLLDMGLLVVRRVSDVMA